MSNDSKALKSGIWYTISNFLLKSVGFITTPIFTRLLTQEDFGAYNNFSSWLHILTIIVTLDLGATLISAKFDYKENYDQYILSMLGLSGFSAICWIIVVNLFPSYASNFLGMDIFYVNCLFCYLLFFPAINLFQIRERYQYGYKKTVLTSIIVTLGTALASVVLVLSMQNRLAGRIIGSIIPTVVIGFLLYGFFINKGEKIDFRMWKYALPICLPYIPHLLSLTLLNSMDRAMITKMCGTKYTALYSLAYNCGAIVTLLMTSLNSAFAPWLGEQLKGEKYEKIRSFSKKYIFGFAYLALGLMLLAPEILLIIGGKNYLSALYVIPPVAMGCICQFMYTLFVNIEQFNKKTTGMAFASMGAAMINYILNCLFIPRFGYMAAAYTTLVGYLFLLLAHMIIVKRIGFSKIYSYSFILFSILVIGCIATLINFIYDRNLVRYICICGYSIVSLYAVIRYYPQIKQTYLKIRRA